MLQGIATQENETHAAHNVSRKSPRLPMATPTTRPPGRPEPSNLGRKPNTNTSNLAWTRIHMGSLAKATTLHAHTHATKVAWYIIHIQHTGRVYNTQHTQHVGQVYCITCVWYTMHNVLFLLMLPNASVPDILAQTGQCAHHTNGHPRLKVTCVIYYLLNVCVRW